MRGNILAGIISIVLLAVTIRAIRKKQLTEMHAILWLGVSLATALLSASLPFGSFTPLAHLFGMSNPPDMVLVFGLFFFALFTFHLSVSMSRLSAHQKVLVQELALMKEMLDSESAS
ncbi:MAG: DUF2304 domain-containing protein [Actinomycetota bacterium]|jgi:hypothetical protein|nr:DUF2304 domain-containing protein [Actinomycetota bacterium]